MLGSFYRDVSSDRDYNSGRSAGGFTIRSEAILKTRVCDRRVRSAASFFSPVRPQGCEINRLYVDDAGGRARKIAGSHVIVIGRLGDGERSSQLNRRRLEEVQRFLEQLVSVKSVTAGGKRVQGYGVVELYVGGRLLYTLPLQRNRPIHLGSCEFP